jgi:DUF1365 family protein
VVTPYVVRGRVAHRRRRPFDYAFEHRTTAWLVDAADPEAAFPRWLGPVLRIRGDDHLGAGDARLLTKVRSWLAENEVAWSADTVRVLVNARTFGHVFDPLTTYFCFDSTGRLEGILAEVHNTYGGQHCYALPAPAADVAKAFYVSPFFEVRGRYEIRARLSEDDVAVSISLTQDGDKVFTGSVHGRLVPATRAAVLRAFLRDPFASQRVSLLIRWHGVRLWLRRLPVVPRDRRPAADDRREAA